MILFIVPVRNEVKTILNSVSELRKYIKGKPAEVLFIDDGSSDGTLERLCLLNHQKISTVRNKFDRGKGSALKTGVVLSEYIYRLNDDDCIVFMDGDGQANPGEIDTFKRIMDFYNADVIIGNKRHKFSITKYGFLRQTVSKGYNLMTRTLFGINFEDTQCGLKMFKKKCLDSVIHDVGTKRYAFDLELIVAMKEKGFRICDSPVTIRTQLNQGSVSLISIFHTFIDTIVIWYKKMKGHYGKGNFCYSTD